MNNLNLVDFAKRARDEKWGYVWGTFGQVLTPELFTQKLRDYTQGVGNYFDFIKTHWVGKKTTDCVGLIKGAYWSATGPIIYNGATDVTADGMYDNAHEKGPIATMPDIPGICVGLPGHIGVYIGGGLVVEAHGTEYGVIQTPLHGGTPWTKWCKCPYIDYVTQTVVKPAPAPIAPATYVDGSIKQLQHYLNISGITRSNQTGRRNDWSCTS